jgi:hypothetical protein
MYIFLSTNDNSILYRKVAGTTCGRKEPQAGTLLNAEKSISIHGWINIGSKK